MKQRRVGVDTTTELCQLPAAFGDGGGYLADPHGRADERVRPGVICTERARHRCDALRRRRLCGAARSQVVYQQHVTRTNT